MKRKDCRGDVVGFIFHHDSKQIKTYPSITDEEIDLWEQKLSTIIPQEYKMFLNNTNGLKYLDKPYFLLGSHSSFIQEQNYLDYHISKSYLHAQKKYDILNWNEKETIEKRFIQYFLPYNFVFGGDYNRCIAFFNYHNQQDGFYEVIIWDYQKGIIKSYNNFNHFLMNLMNLSHQFNIKQKK